VWGGATDLQGGPIFFPSHLVWGPAKKLGASTLAGGAGPPWAPRRYGADLITLLETKSWANFSQG